MSNPRFTFQPVEGEAIRISRGLHSKLAVAMTGSLLVGILLILLHFIGERGTVTLLTGSFFTIMALILLPIFVHGMFSNKRLIIGQDRLQMVRGEANVLAQIPYDNISRVAHLKEERFEAVGIDLRERNRSDTTWPGGEFGYDFGKKEFGYEITFGHDCLIPPLAIHEKIVAKMKRIGESGHT